MFLMDWQLINAMHESGCMTARASDGDMNPVRDQFCNALTVMFDRALE